MRVLHSIREKKTLFSFLFLSFVAGCSGSEVSQLTSSPVPAQSSAVKNTVSVGTGSTPSPSIVSTAVGVSPAQDDAARRKEDFERDLIKMDKEQAAKDKQMAQADSLARYQAMANLIPVLAMTAMFTNLSEKVTGGTKCIPKNSTYNSLLKDSNAILDKAAIGLPADPNRTDVGTGSTKASSKEDKKTSELL